MTQRILSFILFIVLLLVSAKDKHKFKTCEKSHFCVSHRNIQGNEPIASISSNEVISDGTYLKAPIFIDDVRLDLKFYVTVAGVLRLQIDEEIPRWKSPGVFVEEAVVALDGGLKEVFRSNELIRFELSTMFSVEVEFNPFKFTLFEGGAPTIVVNGFKEFYYKAENVNNRVRKQGLINVDSDREIIDWGEDGKPIYATEAPEDEVLREEEGINHEISSGTGNEVGVDVSFINSKGVFGIPERTTPFLLPNTKQSKEPYRLYNLDVFEYEIDDTMGLYGNIPFLVSKGSGASSTGMLWNNPSDTFVDLSEETLVVKDTLLKSRKVKWMSEAGNFDLLLYPGNTMNMVLKQNRDTTGPQLLPPMFSLGYHQSRWNYNDQKDFLEVNQGFEKHNIPMDVLWLDIEHTDGRRYFTFEQRKFPDPIAMYKEIEFYGRRAVNIVDPHIKRDDNYIVHQVATREGFYIKDHNGDDFDGWCWPGSSSYIDFTDDNARKFWASMFDTSTYKGTLNNVVHIWNDMNEPSVFNADEVTMPKDCKNLEGVEFREMHNVWGMLFHASSQAGLLHRDLSEHKVEDDNLVWRNLFYKEEPPRSHLDLSLQRGFVLSRAFYAGSQRSGAIWTGDNTAEWSHLKITVPMLFSLGIAGISFTGADVGGFFGDPSTELLVRWYQAASLQPFFRGHAHIDTKRREPWLFGEENTDRIRSAIALRYRLLPYFYSTFYLAEKTGLPVMRPLFMNFWDDDTLLTVEDQWMIGSALLVAPVMEEGATTREVVFPSGRWFHVETLESYDEGTKRFDVNMETILAFFRAGQILPLKSRMRRATKHMKEDPYTLVIALNDDQVASGNLYIDDEETYDYVDKEAFCRVVFTFNGKVLSARAILGNPNAFIPKNHIEKIIITGAKHLVTVKTAKVVSSGGESEVEILKEKAEGVIIVRNPKAVISENFSVYF